LYIFFYISGKYKDLKYQEKQMNNNSIRNICMLSTHGYVDPVPQLGRTDTGGQVVYVLQLSKALSALGIRIDIYTRWFDPEKSQVDTLPDNSRARIIRIPSGPWEFIPKERLYETLPELAENMKNYIQENNLDYDLFHAHYVDAGIVAAVTARAMEKPFFFTAHSLGAWKKEQMGGDPDEMEKKYNFKLRIKEERRIFELVHGQSVTTPLQKQKLEELYGFRSENIEVIPPGTDIHHYCLLEDTKDKIKTPLPEKYIFCLSRIDTNKGHDHLLTAFHMIKEKIPDIHLVIGGGSPKPEPREKEIIKNIKKFIEQKDMEGRVLLIGYVPDELMAPYYRQAELFVLPSLFEPFGMTATEAMACGTPIVASKFGGIKNVISSGENGLLVDPTNPEEFASALMTLLENKSLAEEMGMKGHETVKKEYSWEAIARKHLDFYKKFLLQES
jgi:mannosylfructose-phosphate synthase